MNNLVPYANQGRSYGGGSPYMSDMQPYGDMYSGGAYSGGAYSGGFNSFGGGTDGYYGGMGHGYGPGYSPIMPGRYRDGYGGYEDRYDDRYRGALFGDPYIMSGYRTFPSYGSYRRRHNLYHRRGRGPGYCVIV